MMGVPLSGLTNTFGDNMSVVHKSQMKTLLIWLLRLSTVDRRDPNWFQKFCMIFTIDVMIWFTIWFPHMCLMGL